MVVEWRAVERSEKVRFRWTAKDIIKWVPSAPPPPCIRVRIVIPLLMEISRDFASHCQLSYAGQTRPVNRRGRDLFVDFAPGDGGDPVVVLTTPTPISPFELTGVQDRLPLGLTVRLNDAA